MRQAVEKFLREQNMLSGQGIVAGLSGGADSVCLLLLLRDLKEQYGFPLYAVHVHHGIRGAEADGDAKFSKELCERIGVTCFEYRIDIPKEAKEKGIGEEEAGRRARYRLFEETARKVGAGAVAVAHHRDDNAETVLFRLCRGTGIRGLCGIPAVSKPFASEEILLIRPLLSFSREEILEELSRRGETFRTDATNAENEYSRNRIRNEVFPLLREINAGADEHIAAFTEHARMLTELLTEETERAYRDAFSDGILLRDKLMNCPRIVRLEVLLRFAKELAGAEKDFTEQHAEAMEQLLSGPVSKELSLPYRLTLVSTYEGIRRKEACAGTRDSAGAADGNESEDSAKASKPAEIKLLPGRYPLTDGRILTVAVREHIPGEPVAKNKWIKWLDYDMIKGVPMLRTRRGGDFFQAGRDGGTKLLREYFVTAKVPREERDRKEVVACGSEILWIPGERGTERYYVTEQTKRILVLEVQNEG
ncbi:MAG: tRNA lysidine(34) synthetase TilS [Lachnospiraceae bacterium]|nr:tRNA lysidine(34) synthetase TilS [Lachnospiraceae bacterium]